MEMMMMAREIVVKTRGVMDMVAAEEIARLAVMWVKAKETFKVIYGLGNAADRLRLLQEESREAKRLRE